MEEQTPASLISPAGFAFQLQVPSFARNDSLVFLVPVPKYFQGQSSLVSAEGRKTVLLRIVDHLNFVN